MTRADQGADRLSRMSAMALALASVALTVGLGQLVAGLGIWWGLCSVNAAPLTGLADAFIDRTPEWLKTWAIETFGTGDKTALLIGMVIVLVLVAGVLGLLTRRRPWTGRVIVVALLVVGEIAVATRPDARLADQFPLLLGAVAGLTIFRLGFPVPRVRGTAPLGPAPAEPAGSRTDGALRSPAAPTSPASRRQALRLAGLGAVSAAVSVALSALVPSAKPVEESRQRVRIPTSFQPQPTIASSAPASLPAPNSSSTLASSAVPEQTSPTASTPTSAPTSATATTATATTTATPTLSSPAPDSPLTAGPDLDHVPDISPYVTPNNDFYRVDTAFSPPLVTAENWSLRIHGAVNQKMKLSYEQLIARPQIERSITLTCVSLELDNSLLDGTLVGNAAWIGARLDTLLAEAGPLFGADCVLATSIDGFTTTTPLAALTDGRDAMLAVAMNGQPLPIEHGFPVRMVVPGLYGYVSACKWVVDLEITQFAVATAYWTSRGWSDHGPVKTSSRIDTPGNGHTLPAGRLTAVAGVAWAQHRGISAVQVQIDDGPWQAADLGAALSIDTWRQWRLPWAPAKGRHTLRCRAVDGGGVGQIGTPHAPLPDGATGYHQISVTSN